MHGQSCKFCCNLVRESAFCVNDSANRAQDEAKVALEPIFSYADDVKLQDFRSVFRTGLGDRALLNAVLLTATLATNGNVFNHECLQYQTKTIQTVRERISAPEHAMTISTLGAILLLAGVEVSRYSTKLATRAESICQMRLGMRSQVEIHMQAVRKVLESCKSKKIPLTDGIKRAIFW
jgi:cell division protein FtsL